MENRRVFIWIALAALVIIAAFAGWSYFGRKPPTAVEYGFLMPYTLIPQGQFPPRADQLKFNFAGIIQKVDAKNRFFEIKTVPFFPVSFEPRGFDDKIRIYFDDSLVVNRIFAETENGAIVKWVVAGKPREAGIPDLYPGTPVRVFGELRDLRYFAEIVSIFVYLP